MRRFFIMFVFFFLIYTCPALGAAGDSPDTALFYGPGHTFSIEGPAVPENQPYDYIGVLVSRYYSTPHNSGNIEFYVSKFTLSNQDTWFIPKDQMQNNLYSFPYDTSKDYHSRLFTEYGDNSIFKFEAVHLYRFSDGRDITGEPIELFYKTSILPVITLTTDSNQVVANTIVLSGTVSHEENWDVTISAVIDGVNKSVVVSNTQTAQSWTLTWDVTNDSIEDGIYSNICITADDGNSGISTIIFTKNIIINVPYDEYVYDDLNRLDHINNPSGNTMQYVYDNNGKLIRRYLIVP